VSNLSRIAILTLSIGKDYTRLMAPGLRSKDQYAYRWGHSHIVGGSGFHDPTRPVAWSKIGFWLAHLDLPEFDFLWLSDADSIITNPEISLSSIVSEVFCDSGVHGAWWIDSAGNKNSGQMLVRSRSSIVHRWFTEADVQRDLVNHPWWENMALIRIWERNAEIQSHIALRSDCKTLNAYIGENPEKHWTKDCFVLHYAGMHTQQKWINGHMTSVARPDLAS
jgi:hypothetical protein